jgi:hypothetical protein
VLGALLLVLIALGVAVSIALHKAEPMLRAEIVKGLEEHFHTHVELDSFHVSVVNGLWAEGRGLRIWPPGQPEETAPGANAADQSPLIRPLIRLNRFRFHAPLLYIPGQPVTISEVQLNGLDIDIPPKSHLIHKAAAQNEKEQKAPLVRFRVESIRCDDAHLTIETDKPGKLPLEFEIAHVKLTNAGADGSMQFDAELTNPRPAGLIYTNGRIGPWAVDDPGETPVAGTYQFEHADLGVFKGIAGILESTGKYVGVLRDLTVDGETDTPDFRLTKFGTAMPLHTVFHAHVDGTNGDTYLQPVDATLGQSRFLCEGKVVHVPPGTAANGTATPGGHDILLNVTINGGRMEDFLRLTSKNGTPLLTGKLDLKTQLEIPPGSGIPVDEKLRLKGSFTLEDAQFTSQNVQEKVASLSLHGQGKPKEAKHAEDADVRSAMQSAFTMADGVITLPDLRYTVPGAEIDLSGTYGMEGGVLNFSGNARTDATISQMVGGWKGELLKPADPFFKKDGAGAQVPVHLNGTREDPKFGIDFGHKHTHPQIPGQP